MLRLSGGRVESSFDEALPIEVRELPDDLAALDALLSDPAVLEPVERVWEQTALGHGRPTIPIERFVRWMVSSSAPAGAMRRSCARCRTRCTCGASA